VCISDHRGWQFGGGGRASCIYSMGRRWILSCKNFLCVRSAVCGGKGKRVFDVDTSHFLSAVQHSLSSSQELLNR
jgi:hypothetical protein